MVEGIPPIVAEIYRCATSIYINVIVSGIHTLRYPCHCMIMTLFSPDNSAEYIWEVTDC